MMSFNGFKSTSPRATRDLRAVSRDFPLISDTLQKEVDYMADYNTIE